MKILHLINSIGDGGAETQVKNYVLNLDETKFKCAILSENIDLSSANADILLRSSVPIYSPFVPKMNIFCKIIQRIQRLLIPKKQKNGIYELVYPTFHSILQAGHYSCSSTNVTLFTALNG